MGIKMQNFKLISKLLRKMQKLVVLNLKVIYTYINPEIFRNALPLATVHVSKLCQI